MSADEDGKLAGLIGEARCHYNRSNLHRHPDPFKVNREVARREAQVRRREEFDMRREEAAARASERLAQHDLQDDLDALLDALERDDAPSIIAPMMLPNAPRVTHEKDKSVNPTLADTPRASGKSPSVKAEAKAHPGERPTVGGEPSPFLSLDPSSISPCLVAALIHEDAEQEHRLGRDGEAIENAEPAPKAKRAKRAASLGSTTRARARKLLSWAPPCVSQIVDGPILDLVHVATLTYPEMPLHPLAKKHEGQRIHLRYRELSTKQELQWISHCLAPLVHQGHRHGAVSLNLSRQIEMKALAEDNPRDWLFRRIQLRLKRAGFDCRFVLIIERAPVIDADEQARRRAKGLPALLRLHTHLQAACPSAAFPGVCGALLDAAGRWSDEAGVPRGTIRADLLDRRQLKWRDKPDTGWLSDYLLKQAETFSITRGLAAEARAFYEAYRPDENERRRERASDEVREKRNAKQRKRRKQSTAIKMLAK